MIIRCLNCGAKNRIPKERMGSHPVCGRCRSHLDEMIIRCLSCGKKNRMPENRLHDRPFCGGCGAPLVVMGAQFSPIDITDGTFSREILSQRGAALVDCWAPWCSPCRLVAPIIDELASKYAGGVKMAKLNVDENPMTASQYNIHSIPTLLLFKDGALVSTLVGLKTKEEIEKQLLSIMKTN
jgi:thioredoxin 2